MTGDNNTGGDNADLRLATVEENRDAAIALATQARFSLRLFTQDLDPRVFDNAELERCLFDLARRHRSADIRIVVNDASRAISQGHCLIRLAQRLTSSVLIHNPAREHSRELSSFMVVDGTGMLHRPRSTGNDYEAVLSVKSPRRAGELSDYFDQIWEKSTPDPQVRRLYI